MGTIVDTTSLISLANNNFKGINYSERGRSNEDVFAMSNQLSGIEAVLISNQIIIDRPSFERNLTKFPELKVLEQHAEFININAHDEDHCYECCADVIVPLMNKPGEFLVDMFRRHIDEIDYYELSTNTFEYFPSTYWRDLSGNLSRGENTLVKALESKFKKYTPFSGAALTNLIRFLYYSACQDMYNCNLSMHYIKSSFLTGFGNYRFKGEEKTAKSILDVFDKKTKDKYYSNLKNWFGSTDNQIQIPLLFNYVKRNRRKDSTLIEDLFELRNTKVCKDFREGIASLQIAINTDNIVQVNQILSCIDRFTNDINEGNIKNPSTITHKIELSIPFIGGLGTEIGVNIPKLRKTSKDKIITFLHNAITLKAK